MSDLPETRFREPGSGALRRGILHCPSTRARRRACSVCSRSCWMVIASTHATRRPFGTPLPVLPGGELWNNLARLQEATNFSQVMLNSLLIAIIYTVFS